MLAHHTDAQTTDIETHMSPLHKVVAESQAAPANRAVKLSIDGFHYKLSAGCLYLDQMLGPVFRLPLLIESQL